jgi:hypothetical protein
MEWVDFTEEFDRQKWRETRDWRGSAGHFEGNSVYGAAKEHLKPLS